MVIEVYDELNKLSESKLVGAFAFAVYPDLSKVFPVFLRLVPGLFHISHKKSGCVVTTTNSISLKHNFLHQVNNCLWCLQNSLYKA